LKVLLVTCEADPREIYVILDAIIVMLVVTKNNKQRGKMDSDT
jgi:DNA polymerase II large subunit